MRSAIHAVEVLGGRRAPVIFSIESPGWDRSPTAVFSLILLGQGFSLGMEFVDAAKDAWMRLQLIQPFSDVTALDPSKRLIAVYADRDPGDLGLRQSGSQLDVAESKSGALLAYLGANRVRVTTTQGSGEVDASEVWPVQGRAGWINVIARAVAQTFAQLADEFELPGAEFHRAPMQLIDPRPNIVVVTDDERNQLQAGGRAQDVIGFPPGWGVGKSTKLDFHPHRGEEPDLDTSRRANGRVQVVEGGAGYRFNALRCDFDCLMRRRPNSASLPIQAGGVEFCRACWGALRDQLNNWRSSDLRRRPRVLLDSQRPLCDTVRWRASVPAVITTPVPFDFEVGTQPKWSCRVEPDRQRGLRLVDVRLKNRPGDPFNQAEDVFKLIEFGDLKVKFAGEAERVLPFADAFANTKAVPMLWIQRDGASANFLGALRLVLTWHIKGRWTIEAVLSVVFKDKNNDFDPGGAAIGNKIFPQIAMRYRRPPKDDTGSLPRVEWLSGSIRLVASNVFPTSLQVHPDLHHFLTGAQQMTLTTDSNASNDDSEYEWDREDVSEIVGDCSGEDVPEWGIWGATWKRGRLLARVYDPPIADTPNNVAEGFAGSVARRGHLTRSLPGLPHWSWLFDYVSPFSSGTKRFVAVYRQGEKTGANLDGGLVRELQVKWPKASDQEPALGKRDCEMTVRKLGRQGAYDNVHVHPKMGMAMGNGREIVPAPFCAELCMHLHWRWGTVGLSGQLPGTPAALDRPQFLGWGRTGRLEQGAHTAPGAPLVPPNQHIEVALAAGAEFSATYEVTAHRPDFDAYQVFLEQGTGVLYSYAGLQPADLANLAGAVGLFNPRRIRDKRRELRELQRSDPARFDREVRLMFHEIYDKIRWYQTLWDRTRPDVQQVPDKVGAPASLEGL